MKLELRKEVTINGCDAIVKARTNNRVQALWDASQAYVEEINKIQEKAKKGDEKKLKELQAEHYKEIADIALEWQDEAPDFESDNFEYDLIIGVRDFFLGMLKI